MNFLRQLFNNLISNVIVALIFSGALLKFLSKLKALRDLVFSPRAQFAAWIPDGDMRKFAKALPHALKQDFDRTMRPASQRRLPKLLFK